MLPWSIRRRAAAGGHNIPDVDVRRRAERSLKQAPRLLTQADYALLIDNSGNEMLPIIDRAGDAINVYRETPLWAVPLVETLTRFS